MGRESKREVRVRLEKTKNNEHYITFARDHEKKMIRNIRGIEKESKVSCREALMRHIDQQNAYRVENRTFYNKIRKKIEQ